MNESQRPGTVVHFVANIDGGVWSTVKTLAGFHRPRWQVMLVGVHAGPLRPAVAADMATHFDAVRLIRRPAVTGAYYFPRVGVVAALKSLGVDPRAENVVCHFHTGPYTSWVYRMPRRPTNAHWLVSFHGSRGSFGDLESRIKRWMHVRGVQELRCRRMTMVAVSRRSAADCAAMYGCRPDEFRVTYNGSGAAAAADVEPRGTPHRPFHVGFVGAVAAAKGWRRVVAAVQQSRLLGLEVVCSIVGDGPEHAELRRLAVEHAPWLAAPGHVDDPQRQVFPALDLLVLPSDCEGHPKVVLEAMAAGVPCVCSDVGGCAETVRNGCEGYILRENAAAEIAARITEIATTDGLWTRLSRNCLDRHRAMFTAERMAADWETLYMESRQLERQR
jgi:glycosyltransferase involved in cell wall biosynthesis